MLNTLVGTDQLDSWVAHYRVGHQDQVHGPRRAVDPIGKLVEELNANRRDQISLGTLEADPLRIDRGRDHIVRRERKNSRTGAGRRSQVFR